MRILGKVLGAISAAVCLAMSGMTPAAEAQLAVRAETLWTMEGSPIADGVVVIGADGKIAAVGPFGEVAIPFGMEVRRCAVATPGLVDVRSTIGLTGIYNVPADQDQFDRGSPMQPQLRAIDAYNPRERLVAYARGFGVTTLHTGHAPGELLSGQTMIVKTRGGTVDDAVVVREAGVAATLSPIAQKGGGQSPGTRARMVEMLRSDLIEARAYARKHEASDAEGKEPQSRDLKLESLARVLSGELPLIVTANKSQDIANALRLADEFGFRLWLDMGAESSLFADELKQRQIPVLLHPTMARAVGDLDALSLAAATALADAGVLFAIQSGYEGYVPKVRIVLFEAAVAAGYGGLGFERGLRAVTIDAARILGIDNRVGSLAVGKDGDVAMYSGDPFEYTTRCIGVIIEGELYVGEEAFERNYP
ncbi:MAG: amidohydrolase family protein [Phycisphaeraceae bacterium]|nr:amidohydrolase family protein [Phycisphaeraceae bacterium]